MKNKKLTFILSCLLFLGFILFVTSDPSFTIVTPRKDQLFTVGNNIISWTPPVNISHVRIELHKGFARVKSLDTWVDNTGKFVWTIYENDKYEYRCDYRIKVLSSIDDDTYGWSEYFCINLHPLNISIVSIIIIAILLTIVVLMYYDKKTHKIQNWIKKVIRKIKKSKIKQVKNKNGKNN